MRISERFLLVIAVNLIAVSGCAGMGASRGSDQYPECTGTVGSDFERGKACLGLAAKGAWLVERGYELLEPICTAQPPLPDSGPACGLVGERMRFGPQHLESVKYLERGCELNDGFACFYLADRIKLDNPERAVAAYQTSCNSGHQDGCAALIHPGLRADIPVPPEITAAAGARLCEIDPAGSRCKGWLSSSGGARSASVASNAAQVGECTDPAEPSMHEACMKSCEADDADGCRRAGRIEDQLAFEDESTRQSHIDAAFVYYAHALALYVAACNRGSAEACMGAALAYQQGTGVPPGGGRVQGPLDVTNVPAYPWPEKAAEFRMKAAELEGGAPANAHAEACGAPPVPSMREACAKACDADDARACYLAGRIEDVAAKQDAGRRQQLIDAAFKYYARTLALREAACKAGSADDCWEAWSAYRRGLGVPPGGGRVASVPNELTTVPEYPWPKKAAEYEKKWRKLTQAACDKGSAQACKDLK